MPTIRSLRPFALALAVLTPLVAAAAPPVSAIPAGNGQQSVTVGATALTVFTYRPAGCAPHMTLLVFHGVSRDADRYRDHARPLADAACATIVAPLFDRARFPENLYQYGGVAAPGATPTVELIPPLAAWARAASGGDDLPVVMIGHSAGAQFVDRVAAFVPGVAARIVIANPSTWVLPSLDTALPFGFGGAGPNAEAELRAYLARPITVLLGTADLKSHELSMTAQAIAQGADRYHRGLNTFHMARDVARQHGWSFGWTLSEVPGIGHNATQMFASPQAIAAVTSALR